MVPTDAQIRALAARIAEEFRPRRIVLFGSVATGTARPDSDVDLLVEMDIDGSAYGAAMRIIRAVRPQFWAHVVVRPPEAMDDLIVQEARLHGVVLYEAAA